MSKLRSVLLIAIIILLIGQVSAETIKIGQNDYTNWDGTPATEISNITEIAGGYSVNWLGMIYNISILNGYDTFAYPNGTFVSANIFPHLNRWTTQGTDRWVEIIPSSRMIYREDNKIYQNMTMYEGGFVNITYTVLPEKIKYTWDFYSGTKYNYSIDFQIHGSASTDINIDTKKYTPGWFNNFTLYDWSDIQSPYLQNISNTIDTNNKIMYQRIVLGQMPIGSRVIIDPSIQLNKTNNDILDDNYVSLYYPTTVFQLETELQLWNQATAYTRAYLRINTSRIPVGSTINSAKLWIYIYAPGQTSTASIYHDTNNSWGNTTLNWNNQPCPTWCNQTAESSNTTLNSEGWKLFNITNMFRNVTASGYNNLSMFLKTMETGPETVSMFRSKDYAFVTWYVDVNYTVSSSNSIPPAPTNLTNTTGNFWVNYTWLPGSGNVTNSYNVSHNGTWINTTTATFLNSSVGAHNWSNISVYAFNSSGTGTLNQTPVSMNTQVSNNAPAISLIDPTPANNSINTTGSVQINTSVSDADGDNMTALLNWNNSLVGWWRMNEAAGGTLVQDFSGYGNNGTWNGNTTGNITSGRFGNALRFDGIDDYVNAGDVTALNNASAFTIEGWINQTDVSSITRIWGKTNSENYDMGLTTYSSGLYFELGNGVNSNANWPEYGTTISNNTWNHVVLIFDGSGSGNISRMKMYVNGIQRTLTFQGGAIPASMPDLTGKNFTIGWYNAPSFPTVFDGSIDELRIWNRVLSTDEINASYNAGSYRLNQTFSGLANGNYNYTAYIQDAYGSIVSTEIRYLTVDINTVPIITNVVNGSVGDTWGIVNFTVDQNNSNTSVHYGTDQSISSITSNQTSGLNRSVNLTGLDNGTKYYYSVFAYNGSNVSKWSNSSIQNFTTNTQLPNNGVSTLIQLTEDTNDIWDDSYVSQWQPTLINGNLNWMNLYDLTTSNYFDRIYLRANTSKIPAGATINSALLYIYEYNSGTTTIASVYHVFADNQTEETLNWNNQPCPIYCNSTSESTNSSLGTIGWREFIITNMFKNVTALGYDNISINIRTPETGTKTPISFRTKEYTYNTTTWYIEVNYSISNDIPPASITNLQNITTANSINWTWTNPTDMDFNYTMVHINGIWITNVGTPYYSNNSLQPTTEYTISTHTVDTAGNVNQTWVNQTTATLQISYPPGTPAGLTYTNGTTWINHTWSAGSGNVTNSYNVSVNGTWTNGTTNTYFLNVVGFGDYSWIKVYAYNNSGYTSLSYSEVNETVQTPDLVSPTLTNITGNYFINWSWNTNIDADEYEVYIYEN